MTHTQISQFVYYMKTSDSLFAFMTLKTDLKSFKWRSLLTKIEQSQTLNNYIKFNAFISNEMTLNWTKEFQSHNFRGNERAHQLTQVINDKFGICCCSFKFNSHLPSSLFSLSNSKLIIYVYEMYACFKLKFATLPRHDEGINSHFGKYLFYFLFAFPFCSNANRK